MNRLDLDEAIDLTTVVIDKLILIARGPGTETARLRYLCGLILADGRQALNIGGYGFWNFFMACFEAAPPAGATFDEIDAVRAVAEAATPTGTAAVAVKNFSVRLSLTEQARILAATEFVSRQDVDRYMDRIDASFDRAEIVAADNRDNVAYQLLIALHAAVSNDLAVRSRPLPRMVTYTFATRKPSLWLAQRLYYDPSRADELIAENKPIHPLFMPQTGAALST